MTHAGLEIGAVVAGRYEVETVLASGGFATVYVARHLGLRCSVALKVLKPDLSDNHKIRKRFLREARVVTALLHPNIVIHHDLGEEPDGRLFLAMEFLDGRSLARAAREAPLSPSRALRVLGQIGQALDFAHERGVLHRDLKPSNVMLVEWAGEPDHAKLIDFGILKHFDDLRRIDDGLTTTLTEPRGVIGTPEYMAPEQIRGQPLRPTTDQYGLAVVAYELLAGRRPFRAATRVETISAQLRDAPPAITRLACGVDAPPGLDAVLGRALAKAPTARYADCAAFIEALGAALEPVLGVEAPPTFEGDPDSDDHEADAPTVTRVRRHTVEVVARREAPVPRETAASIVRRTAPALRVQDEPPTPPAPVDLPASAAAPRGMRRRRLPWALAAAAGLVGVMALLWALVASDRGGAEQGAVTRSAAEEPRPDGALQAGAQGPGDRPGAPELGVAGAPRPGERPGALELGVAGAPRPGEPGVAAASGGPAAEGTAEAAAERAPAEAPLTEAQVVAIVGLRGTEPSEPGRARRSPAPTPLELRPAAEPRAAPRLPVQAPATVGAAKHEAKVKPQKTGTLSVAVRPIGRIWIDGRAVGEGMVRDVRVPAGTRRVRIANVALGVERTVPVVVPAGGSRKLLVDLEKGTTSVR